jgi:hypothetical protein
MNAALPTKAERRERLALQCQLDRLHLKLLLKKAQHTEPSLGGLPLSSLGNVLSLAQLIPGKIGRLSRGFALGSELFRAAKFFRR